MVYYGASSSKIESLLKEAFEGVMSAVIQADLDSLSQKAGHSLSEAERVDAMKRAMDVLNSRLDQFGLSEPVIRQQGSDQIYVEIPGTPDPDRINSIIMGKGNLAFYIVDNDATSSLNVYLKDKPLGVDEATMIAGAVGRLPPIEVKLKGVTARMKPSRARYSSRFQVCSPLSSGWIL